MRKALKYITLLIFIFVIGCKTEEKTENTDKNLNAVLLDKEGNPIPLDENKIIVVNFLSYSCVSCMKELPVFKQVLSEEKYKDKFQFVGIVLDSSEGDFSDKNFPIYPNNNRNFVRFKVNGTPTTYIILPNGRKLIVIYGAITPKSLRKFLDEALRKAEKYKK